VYVLLSDPVTTTAAVALVAVTVNSDELPGETDVGFALIVTVAAGPDVTVTLVVAVAVFVAPTAVAV
jgi:hypothetical protein